MHDFWVLVIGLCAGVITRVVTPGKKAPFGFMLTSLLGISGAFVAAYLGQEAGWFRADGVAGLITDVYDRVDGARVPEIPDPPLDPTCRFRAAPHLL